MVKIISEIGINHNGSITKCKELIMLSKIAGMDYVKNTKKKSRCMCSRTSKICNEKDPLG